MKEHNHHGKENEIVEEYREEGPLTVETLDVVSHDAHSTSHHKGSKSGFILTTPVAIIIASIIISLGLVSYGSITNGGSTAEKNKQFAGRSIDSTDYVTGKVDSKVIVVEYSDPECPFCVKLYPTMKQLHDKYDDRVTFVYRHFPLVSIHPKAFDESRAIACAGTIGGGKALRSYVDALYGEKFSTQNPNTLQFQPLPQNGKELIAKKIGLDNEKFSSCMNTGQTAKNVEESMKDGVTAGVQGTPSTYVLIKTRKGYDVVTMIDGAQSVEYFEAAIDQALN
ncbi:DsbA family protein [Candidatus Gracilibacteria bacterium]|nr:DsbA family protein [Candidatus Gracilibacteria bacterium]